MYKRQDWVHVHGQTGGASSSEESQPDVTGSSKSEASSDAQSTEGPASGGDAHYDREDSGDAALQPSRRLEDLSEDDFEGASPLQDDAELAEQIRLWLSTPDAKGLRGDALKCRLCRGVLILNALSLRQHLASKRHKAKAKGAELALPICFAKDEVDQEDGETHNERLQRIGRHMSSLQAEVQGKDGKQGKQKRHDETLRTRHQRKKPGKRQRALKKAERA